MHVPAGGAPIVAFCAVSRGMNLTFTANKSFENPVRISEAIHCNAFHATGFMKLRRFLTQNRSADGVPLSTNAEVIRRQPVSGLSFANRYRFDLRESAGTFSDKYIRLEFDRRALPESS